MSNSQIVRSKNIYRISLISFIGVAVNIFLMYQFYFSYWLINLLNILFFATCIVVGILYNRYRLAYLELDDTLIKSEKNDFRNDVMMVFKKLESKMELLQYLQSIFFSLGVIGLITYFNF